MNTLGEALCLRKNEIHLWLVFDVPMEDSLLELYRQLLSEAEQSQELRFRFASDRRRYRITRALIRTVLSRYVNVRPDAWQFKNNAYGRPEIAFPERGAAPFSFNISHTDGLIVLGITSAQAVGLDVEKVLVQPLSHLADNVFSPEEAAALRSLPVELRREIFFHYWTLKESYIKAKGKGLSIPLDCFSFQLMNPQDIKVRFQPELKDSPARWRFWMFRPAINYIAAVCVERCSGEDQRLLMRKTVPLLTDESLDCTVLRKSE